MERDTVRKKDSKEIRETCPFAVPGAWLRTTGGFTLEQLETETGLSRSTIYRALATRKCSSSV